MLLWLPTSSVHWVRVDEGEFMSVQGASLKDRILAESKRLAENDPDWEWVVSKQIYKWQLFKDSALIIDPFWQFSWKSLAQPRVWVENKLFSKVKKLYDIKYGFGAWHYLFQSYYPRDICPAQFKIYKNGEMIDFSPPTSFREAEMTDVVSRIFEFGKNIFNQESDYSDEKAFLRACIDTSDKALYGTPEHHRYMRGVTVEGQAILRLLLLGDKAYAEAALETFKGYGGSHRENIPKLLPHMDEIIEMSPYV